MKIYSIRLLLLRLCLLLRAVLPLESWLKMDFVFHVCKSSTKASVGQSWRRIYFSTVSPGIEPSSTHSITSISSKLAQINFRLRLTKVTTWRFHFRNHFLLTANQARAAGQANRIWGPASGYSHCLDIKRAVSAYRHTFSKIRSSRRGILALLCIAWPPHCCLQLYLYLFS